MILVNYDRSVMIIEKPNGRWAWVVVLSAACVRIIVYGIANTSGVVYVVMLDVFERSKAETSWISSLITAVTFFLSPFSGLLVNRFGTRKVAFCGGLVASTGLIASSFAPNLFLLCIFYGVVTGVGCGLTFIPASVAVAKYFKKRRNLAMGIASAGGGVGSFIFPPVIKFLNDYYQWRGMFMFVSGIALNICIFAMLFRPVCDESDPEVFDDADSDTVDIKNQRDMQNYRKRKLSLRTKNRWDFVRNYGFHILAANNFLFGFGCSIVYGHLEAYVKYELGVKDFRGALLYSVIGITVLFSKLGQGLLANMKRYRIFHPMYQYIFFYSVGGIATLCLLIKTSYTGMVIYSIAFGTSYASNGGCIIPAILIDMTGLESFSLSYGVILWVFAAGLLLGAPTAGFMNDRLNSYQPAFVLASIVMLISAAIMIFPCRDVYSPQKSDEVTINVDAPSEKQIKFDPELNIMTGSGRIYTEKDEDLKSNGSVLTSTERNGDIPIQQAKISETEKLLPNTNVSNDEIIIHNGTKPEDEKLLSDQNLSEV
ncbi:hypothetical protein KUTeg_012071 [Tegillarca granosa]|uniref:Major facilitator superfamily (MFS) profile domain-containing protein n=1 Tax=Tegillarca granosa TaxID=220873 RepID=A0ABQ9EYG3_TEGGR|nr:hypothetical protein KUTeg_012071 [Tegillarca granosa]